MESWSRKSRPHVAQSDPLEVAAVKKLHGLASILRHTPSRKFVDCFGAVNPNSGQFARMMCLVTGPKAGKNESRERQS